MVVLLGMWFLFLLMLSLNDCVLRMSFSFILRVELLDWVLGDALFAPRGDLVERVLLCTSLTTFLCIVLGALDRRWPV